MIPTTAATVVRPLSPRAAHAFLDFDVVVLPDDLEPTNLKFDVGISGFTVARLRVELA